MNLGKEKKEHRNKIHELWFLVQNCQVVDLDSKWLNLWVNKGEELDNSKMKSTTKS